MPNEPEGAPHCWGKQFQDGDDECSNCDYNSSCRPATLHQISVRRQTTTPTYVPPPSYQPTRFGPPPPPMMPQPSFPQPSQYPRTTSPYPMSPPPQPMAPAMPPMNPQFAPPGWNTPIAYLPRPNPATPAWWQYGGETTRSRLTKNVILSALQAIFAELLRFFTNWTWPTSRSITT